MSLPPAHREVATVTVVRRSHVLLSITLVLMLLLAGGALLIQAVFGQATQAAERRGSIVISDAALTRVDDHWQLQAAADIVLPVAVQAGLDSGVPLEFLVELDIREPRSWWFDRTIQQLRHRYLLNYFELTRHYRLQSEDSGESRHYRSLQSALAGLGHLQLNDVAEGVASAGTVARLRVKLDGEALPLPLQPLVASSWRLTSKPYVWNIQL